MDKWLCDIIITAGILFTGCSAAEFKNEAVLFDVPKGSEPQRDRPW